MPRWRLEGVAADAGVAFSPLAQVEDCPVGLSLVGPPGSDEQLIDLASHLNSSGR